MPRLIVVPTPIGNLEDITLRALRALRDVPVIFAEDTRHTRKLLTHYGISTRLLSLHQHNETTRIPEVLDLLKHGDVALVSDAGMPFVSDPGFMLLRSAITNGVEVDVLPGASAVVTAVAAAALPSAGFAFLGFLPRKTGERRKKLSEVAEVALSLVFYEAPSRLARSLQDVESVLGPRPAVVCRELTKLHQEVARGTLSQLIERFREGPVKGEVTVVVAPAEGRIDKSREATDELLERLANGESRRVAITQIAEKYGVSRNRLYQESLRSPTREAERKPG